MITNKNIKTITVSFEEYTDYMFQHPATYFYKDCMGNFIYICTRDRRKAQEYVDEQVGAGKYKIIAAKISKGKPLGEGSRPVNATATRSK